MKLSKTEQKYKNLINRPKGLFQEREIISMRSFFNSGMTDTKNTLLQLFDNMIEQHGEYQLTIEQQIKGIEWLKRTQLNKKGELRQAKTTFLGKHERSILLNYSHFTFVGLRNIGNYHDYYVPIYRCYSSDGNYFDYSASQSGCEVI